MTRATPAAWVAALAFSLSPAYGALLAPAAGCSKWAGLLAAPGGWLVTFSGFLAWRLARDIRRRSPLVEGAVLWLWWTVIVCIGGVGAIAIGAAILLQAVAV